MGTAHPPMLMCFFSFLKVNLYMGRLISLIIALLYLLIAFFSQGGVGFLKMLSFVMFALMLIWFGDEVGSYIGPTGGIGSIHTTQTSPGPVVRFMGWVILFLPLVFGIYLSFSGL